MQNETISLYFRENGSDKEYHADLVEAEGGYVVNTRYGLPRVRADERHQDQRPSTLREGQEGLR